MTNPPTVDIEEGRRLLAEAKKNDHAPGDEYGAPPAVLKLGNWSVNHLPALLAKAREAEELREALRQANFFRDRLAERIRLVEAAILELDCALANDTFPGDVEGEHQEEHWRNHVVAAVALCRRATLSVKSRPTRLPLIHHPETEENQ